MIINSENLKNIARQIITTHDTTIQNDIECKKNYIRVRVDLILKQLDSIRAIAPAFNMLKTAKIKFIESYFTEGWYHHLGFSPRRNDLIGVCGGGRCGKSVFVNFENEKFVICNWYSEHSPTTSEISIEELIEKYWNDYNVRNHLNKIAHGITEFAERLASNIENY